jgi:hypothetical protein
MQAAQRLFANESFERLDAERKPAACQRPLGTNVPGAQPLQVLGQEVFRAIDNPQVLGASALDRWLCNAATPSNS